MRGEEAPGAGRRTVQLVAEPRTGTAGRRVPGLSRLLGAAAGWVGIASPSLEWGIVAGRFLLVAALVLVVATVHELSAARSTVFWVAAFAVAYGVLLALDLRAGHTRRAMLAGIGLDTVTAVAGITMSTYVVAREAPGAIGVASPRDAPILLLLTATAGLRLRPPAAILLGAFLTLVPAGLRVVASDGLLDGSDFLLQAARIAAAAAVFTLVGQAFQRTRDELQVSVTKQARLSEEAGRRAREQEALAAIGQTIGSSLAIGEVYERFAGQMRAVLPFDRACIATVDPGEQEMTTRYVAGRQIERLPVDRRRPLTERGLFEEVARTGLPLRVDDLAASLDRYPEARAVVEAGLRSGVYAPLLSKGAVIGTLAVASSGKAAYTDDDLALLVHIADQIAGGVANAELHARVDRQAHEEAVLAEIGRIISSARDIAEVYEQFAGRVKLLLPFDRLSIATAGPGSGQITVDHASGAPIEGWEPGAVHNLREGELETVFGARAVLRETGQDNVPETGSPPLRKEALAAGLRSGLVAPLISGDEVIGGLSLRSFQEGAYGEADEAVAERVAAQIAGAVASSWLRAQTEREAEERTVLAEIGRVVGSSLDLTDVYPAFGDLVRRLLAFDRMAIAYIDAGRRRAVYAWAAGEELAGVGVGQEIPIEAFRGNRLGDALESGRPAILSEAEVGSFLGNLPWVGDSSVRSMIAVPLISGNAVIAGLSIASREADAYNEGDLAIAERIGRQIAGAVANTLLHAALREASDELRESVAQKTDLISTVAHELRSPLTSLRAYLDLILDKAVGEVPERQRELLERAGRSTLRLQNLLGEFSHLEIAENPSIELSLDRVDLGALAENAREVLEPAAMEGGVAIALLGFDDLPPVEADAQAIEQVFSNLLSNAIKYSPGGGRVEVRAGMTDSEVSVQVRDEGLGISEADRARLFERFSRGTDPAKLRVRGTGLGLYVSRGLVERHGGHMDVESRPGAGSTFTFALPLRQPSDGREPEARSDL